MALDVRFASARWKSAAFWAWTASLSANIATFSRRAGMFSVAAPSAHRLWPRAAMARAAVAAPTAFARCSLARRRHISARAA
jgi:hypothetical protein